MRLKCSLSDVAIPVASPRTVIRTKNTARPSRPMAFLAQLQSEANGCTLRTGQTKQQTHYSTQCVLFRPEGIIRLVCHRGGCR